MFRFRFNDPKPPEICPVCGEDVPPKALACPQCGADHNSGWREDALIYDGVDLPDRNADGSFRGGGESYEEFMRREFGPRWNWWPPNIKWLWAGVAIILILCFLIEAGGWAVLQRLFNR
jgi:hypothetical protein